MFGISSTCVSAARHMTSKNRKAHSDYTFKQTNWSFNFTANRVSRWRQCEGQSASRSALATVAPGMVFITVLVSSCLNDLQWQSVGWPAFFCLYCAFWVFLWRDMWHNGAGSGHALTCGACAPWTCPRMMYWHRPTSKMVGRRPMPRPRRVTKKSKRFKVNARAH